MKNDTTITSVNSAADKAYIIEQIDNCAKATQAVLDTITPAQFIAKPSAEEWSLSECLEHMMLFDKLIFGTIQKLSQTPRDTTPENVMPKEKLMHLVTKRGRKVQSPEFCVPTGKYTDKAELIALYLEQHDAIKAFVEHTEVDLKKVAFKHFIFGLLDAVCWLCMIGGHGQRHILQMKEVIAK